MRTYLIKGFLCLFVFTLFSLPLQSQESRSFVILVDYMKSHPGQDAVSLETDIFQPVHKQIVGAGDKMAWACYEVLFPNGKNVEYNYVTVNVYESAEKYHDNSGMKWADAFAKAHPGKSADEAWEKMSKARDWVKTEMFTFVDEAVEGPPLAGDQMVKVNYMKTAQGMGDSYVDMESKYFKPAHKMAVKDGAMVDWQLYALTAPTGSSMPYNYITVDTYNGAKQMYAPYSNDMEKVHPGENIDKIWESMMKTRTLVRSETWVSRSSTF
ncbi:MAG: hypothetical protein HKN16_10195 [Saprospiraceae bacterium]|nr:hypothetical protein [Saprospiraceae bacterium]